MVAAYVLVKANTGDADRLKESMLGVDGVVSANVVAGDVDFVVEVDVGSPGRVKDVATAGIAGIDGIESTRTYIAMD